LKHDNQFRCETLCGRYSIRIQISVNTVEHCRTNRVSATNGRKTDVRLCGKRRLEM